MRICLWLDVRTVAAKAPLREYSRVSLCEDMLRQASRAQEGGSRGSNERREAVAVPRRAAPEKRRRPLSPSRGEGVCYSVRRRADGARLPGSPIPGRQQQLS